MVINPEQEVIDEEGESVPEAEADISHALFDQNNPDPTVLLYSNLTSSESIKKPTVGIGGISHLQASDFVEAQHEHGVLLVREGENCQNQNYQKIDFPMMTEEKQNISYDEGG